MDSPTFLCVSALFGCQQIKVLPSFACWRIGSHQINGSSSRMWDSSVDLCSPMPSRQPCILFLGEKVSYPSSGFVTCSKKASSGQFLWKTRGRFHSRWNFVANGNTSTEPDQSCIFSFIGHPGSRRSRPVFNIIGLLMFVDRSADRTIEAKLMCNITAGHRDNLPSLVFTMVYMGQSNGQPMEVPETSSSLPSTNRYQVKVCFRVDTPPCCTCWVCKIALDWWLMESTACTSRILSFMLEIKLEFFFF